MRRSVAVMCLVLAACAPPARTGPERPVAKPVAAGPSPTASVAVRGRPNPPSDNDICSALPKQVARALDGIAPYAPLDSSCRWDDPFCDTTEAPPDANDACFVANENLSRAEQESRSAVAAPMPCDPWDGVARPRYLDRVDAHLHLTSTEHERLRANGFVVLDRLSYADYASAFHDIFQQQLPLYVGIDPILHAVFRGTELALERVEREKLVPALSSMLRKLRAALSRSGGLYRPETLDDLDVLLGVAHTLAVEPRDQAELSGSWFGNEEKVSELVSLSVEGALRPVSLFGRVRMVDFSQLQPRGHYAGYAPGKVSLEAYFRSVMWLSRVELNLVSRSCRSSHPGVAPDPSETPREARAALALADLVQRSGASVELGLFEQVYSAFAGRREDVAPAELARLMRVHRISPKEEDGFAKLKSSIGDRYRRTARTHFMPQGTTELPAIATLFGPRIVPDIAALSALVHDAVPERYHTGAADVAYILGHDRAETYLADEVQRFPVLQPALARARATLDLEARRGNDIYASWLRAVLSLGVEPEGVTPSFMKRDAFADLRMNSAIVGYGQIRHAYVLLAAQGYDSYGCEIPDAFVEPAPATFDSLLAHVRSMRSQVAGWRGLERALTMLRAIAGAESEGKPLTEPQRRWLAMVAEKVPAGGYEDSGQPPKWTGWYFDMFEDREHGATASAAFVADVFTLTNAGEVLYVGADGPRLAVFLVDVGGEPRAMVGPVAKGYEARAPIGPRVSDDEAGALVGKTAAWRTFAVSARPEPALGLEGRFVRCGKDGSWEWRVALRSDVPVGGVEVTLLDHHSDPITAALELRVGDAWEVHGFALSSEMAGAKFGAEGVHVRIRDLAGAGMGTGRWDHVTSPSVFGGTSLAGLGGRRPRGVVAFRIGGAVPADDVPDGGADRWD